jgi:hypothetical protein
MSELLARLPEPNEVEPAPGSAISGLTKLVVGVVLPGLRLAATDATRGVLARAQLDRIRGTVTDLVGELDAHWDDDPPALDAEGDPTAPESPKRSRLQLTPTHDGQAAATSELAAQMPRQAPPILCVAGRGPFDGLVALILTQLLSKHGLRARTVHHEAVSRAGIGTFNAQGIRTLCAAYLEITGTPSHVRYLLQRLRQRLPAARMVVGLWQAGHPILNDSSLRATIGADTHVTSLREAVGACVEAEQRITAVKDGAAPAA